MVGVKVCAGRCSVNGEQMVLSKRLLGGGLVKGRGWQKESK